MRTVEVKFPFENLTMHKDLQDGEEICETCKGLGMVIQPNVYGIKGEHGSDLFPYRKEALVPCLNCYDGARKVCPHCGKQIRKKSNGQCTCEGALKELRDEWARKAKEMYAKAEKITVEQARERGIVMLYHADQDDSYIPMDELEGWLRDWLVDHDYPRLYVTACRKLSFNAVDLVINATAELHDEAYENITGGEIMELQGLLDAWAAKITGTDTYFPDYRVAVVIADPEAEVWP